MQVDVRTQDGVVVVAPVGDIDGKTAPEFADQVLPLIVPGARIVVTLGQVRFMSSAGLRSMWLIHREATAKGVTVVLAEINKNVHSAMAATGFLTFFAVCDSVAGAIQAAG